MELIALLVLIFTISMSIVKEAEMLGDEICSWIRKRTTLLPFHAEWIKKSFHPECQISALSVARGNAKTWLFGWLGACAMTPGAPLWREGVEVLRGERELRAKPGDDEFLERVS